MLTLSRPRSIQQPACICAVIVALALQAGCASLKPSKPLYTFAYKASDSPGVIVLDYNYSAHGKPIRATATGFSTQSEDSGWPQTSITGRLPVGDKLYVKWRNSAGVVNEETISLANRLPSNMEGAVVYFVAGEQMLNVYVAHNIRNRRKLNSCKELFNDYREGKSQSVDHKVKMLFCERHLEKIHPEPTVLNP